MVAAWTQLFGLVSFELTNQTRGIIDSHERFFILAVRTTGYAIGLRSGVARTAAGGVRQVRTGSDRTSDTRANRR